MKELGKGIVVPTVDFTKTELIEELKGVFATKEDLRSFASKEDLEGFATKGDVRGIVHEELDKFEPKMKRLMRLENMESEVRIKTDIKSYVDAKHRDLKGAAGAIWPGGGEFARGLRPYCVTK